MPVWLDDRRFYLSLLASAATGAALGWTLRKQFRTVKERPRKRVSREPTRKPKEEVQVIPPQRKESSAEDKKDTSLAKKKSMSDLLIDDKKSEVKQSEPAETALLTNLPLINVQDEVKTPPVEPEVKVVQPSYAQAVAPAELKPVEESKTESVQKIEIKQESEVVKEKPVEEPKLIPPTPLNPPVVPAEPKPSTTTSEPQVSNKKDEIGLPVAESTPRKDQVTTPVSEHTTPSQPTFAEVVKQSDSLPQQSPQGEPLQQITKDDPTTPNHSVVLSNTTTTQPESFKTDGENLSHTSTTITNTTTGSSITNTSTTLDTTTGSVTGTVSSSGSETSINSRKLSRSGSRTTCDCRVHRDVDRLPTDDEIDLPKGVGFEPIKTQIFPIQYERHKPPDLVDDLDDPRETKLSDNSLKRHYLTGPESIITAFRPILNSIIYAHKHAYVINDLVDNYAYLD